MLNKQNMSMLGAGLVALVGVVVMIGWMYQLSSLVQIFPSFVPMQFNTAFCFFWSAVSLLLIRRYPIISTGISFLVFLFVVLTLMQYIFHFNAGIDELFVHHAITIYSLYPGRMSPNTAVCFILFFYGYS